MAHQYFLRCFLYECEVKTLEFSFSTISPSNHFWVFLFTLLVLYEANLSITVIIFCTESEYVHRHYQKFRSFGRLIVKGFFYNHKPIVFLWTEVYVLVNTNCFKLRDFSFTKNKLMIWQAYVNDSFLRNSWRESC